MKILWQRAVRIWMVWAYCSHQSSLHPSLKGFEQLLWLHRTSTKIQTSPQHIIPVFLISCTSREDIMRQEHILSCINLAWTQCLCGIQIKCCYSMLISWVNLCTVGPFCLLHVKTLPETCLWKTSERNHIERCVIEVYNRKYLKSQSQAILLPCPQSCLYQWSEINFFCFVYVSFLYLEQWSCKYKSRYNVIRNTAKAHYAWGL